MKLKTNYVTAIFALLYAAVSCSWLLVKTAPAVLWAVIPAFLLVNVLAGVPYRKIKEKLLRGEYHGVESLIIFLAGCVAAAVFHVILFFWDSVSKTDLLISIVWCVAALSVLFWNGIIYLYLTSVQLGIKIRLIGIVFGWIFPVNVGILCYMISRCREEVRFETAKNLLNESRKSEEICKTKYPILMVHGVFFRDFPIVNYWGRIPAELKKNGATVFFGNHQSALAVSDSADEIIRRIRDIREKTGAEKVNIIAHSKGGLDCRCAMNKGASPYVASLTTINTPHRGCGFADYLLKKVKPSVQKKVEEKYNLIAEKAGDESPDFMSAVKDLTAEHCEAFDKEWTAPEGVLCQSVGSCLKKARHGKFPLNFSYHLVKFFDGENDGLVSESSFEWGEKYTYLKPEKKRGISHGDVIDQNRENIPGFDVREFYVGIVKDLKERGL